MSLPPGPRTPPAVNLVRFAARPLQVLFAWQARYGDVFTVKFTVFGTGVYVADPGAIRELFTGDQSDLLAGEANSFMEPVLGPHSVLVLDGPEHLRQRRLLLSPFQGSRVAAFRTVIRQVAERELATWKPGTRVVLRERMRALTFEVICRAVFGVTEPARVARLRSALIEVVDSSPLYLLTPLLRRDLGRWSPGRRFHQRIRAADSLLLRHPAVHARLREELEAGGSDAYLDAVVKETLRLRPVIDASERTLTKPRTVAGWDLPAGVKVYPGIALVHMREDLYPRPHEFRPERFLDERADAYSLIPFGGGITLAPRHGVEVEVARVAAPARSAAPPHDPCAGPPAPTLRPAGYAGASSAPR